MVSRDRGGGAFIFLLRVRSAFFFCCGCAVKAFVRCALAIAWSCASAAGVGLGNPIGHGLRRGLCGAGEGAFIFLLRVRGAFFFCCGCALARGWAGQAESNGAWAGQPGGAFIFLLRVRGPFFFCCGCAVGSLTHLLPGWASGIQLAMVAVGACAGLGGRVYFFAVGVRRFFFLLWVRPCPGLGRSGGIQWGVGRPAGGRVYFFAVGARRVFFCCGCAAGSLTHLLPGRASGIQLAMVSVYRGLCGAGGGGAFIFLLRVRGAFFFFCGCALARGSAGHAESNGAWAGQSGGAFIFLLQVRGAFFFLLWVRGRFAHSLAAGRLRASTAERHPGSVARFFFLLRVRELCGGAFIFLLRVRGAFIFFAADARAHSLTHSLPAARRAPTAKKHTQQKQTRVPAQGLHFEVFLGVEVIGFSRNRRLMGPSEP